MWTIVVRCVLSAHKSARLARSNDASRDLVQPALVQDAASSEPLAIDREYGKAAGREQVGLGLVRIEEPHVDHEIVRRNDTARSATSSTVDPRRRYMANGPLTANAASTSSASSSGGTTGGCGQIFR